MDKYKWFWITFGAWWFITAAGAWALIYSPFRLSSRLISEFSVEVNKSLDQNQIFLNSSPIDLSLEAVTEKWESKGWKNLAGKTNLATAVLNTPGEYSEHLDQLIQIRAFENKESMRVLGLLASGRGGQTYQWVSEMSKKSFKPQDPSTVDFPFKPPPDSLNILTMKAKNMETLIWSAGSNTNISETFSRVYSSQGFNGKLLSKQNGESFFILRRGSIKLLALISTAAKNNTISLVKLNKI